MRATDVRKAAELKGAKLGGRAQSGTFEEVRRRRAEEAQQSEVSRMLRSFGRRPAVALD